MNKLANKQSKPLAVGAVALEESQLDAVTGADGVPTDSFSLNFEKIRFVKRPPGIKS